MSAKQDIVQDLKSRAKRWPRANSFDSFVIGAQYTHHWGRTMLQADSFTFSLLTMHYNPRYTNEEDAKAHGHSTTPINPYLVFNVVFGLSVEDLSEAGGSFLGLDNLEFVRSVYPGDTLYANSVVLETKTSETRPGYGIVRWRTTGSNQHDQQVIVFERANLLRRAS